MTTSTSPSSVNSSAPEKIFLADPKKLLQRKGIVIAVTIISLASLIALSGVSSYLIANHYNYGHSISIVAIIVGSELGLMGMLSIACKERIKTQYNWAIFNGAKGKPVDVDPDDTIIIPKITDDLYSAE